METLQNNITIFSSNTGLFATFDVTVDQNDVKLTLHKDKSNRDICDLDLRSMVSAGCTGAWPRNSASFVNADAGPKNS